MGSFYRGVTKLVTTYPIFDFALVCICRLYTYYYGYQDLKHEEHIGYEDLIIDYTLEATEEIIKMMAECFKKEIHLYSIYPDVDVMKYIPRVREDRESIVAMKIGNRFCLLERKGEYREIKKESEILGLPLLISSINENPNNMKYSE